MGPNALVKDHGKKLLINIIDDKAQWLADHTYMRYPTPDWENDGYRTLTWKQYADAVNKVAYWLDEKLGQSKGNDTIAYLGPSDVRYAIVLPAAIKSKRKLLIVDGRVTKEGVKKLISASECLAWLYAEDDDSQTREMDIKSTAVQMLAFPSSEWCLDSKDHKPYPYEDTYESAKSKVVCVIHTSGTTGIPKPIFHTNGYYSAFGGFHESARKHFPRLINMEPYFGRSMLVGCPPQWLGGIHGFVHAAVFHDTTAVLPPPNFITLPPRIFKKVLEFNFVEGLIAPPPTIQQLYHDPETKPLLLSLYYVLYLGAALDQAVGDDLIDHTRLINIIGSTETGPHTGVIPVNKKLWHTQSFVPEIGTRMVRIENSGPAQNGSDDLYELVLGRPANGQPPIYGSAFWNPEFDGLDAIETKELYAPVQDSDGSTRWVFKARKDDLTKLSWLAKFHAADIEVRIKKHPDVSNAFVGGEGRPTPYVLVEAKDGVLEKKTPTGFLDELYSSIVTQTNQADHKEIKIPKETVLIASREKPFKLSGKQTLLRKEIEKDYANEIEAAYQRLGKVTA